MKSYGSSKAVMTGYFLNHLLILNVYCCCALEVYMKSVNTDITSRWNSTIMNRLALYTQVFIASERGTETGREMERGKG